VNFLSHSTNVKLKMAGWGEGGRGDRAGTYVLFPGCVLDLQCMVLDRYHRTADILLHELCDVEVQLGPELLGQFLSWSWVFGITGCASVAQHCC